MPKPTKTAKMFSDRSRDYHTKPQANFRMSEQALELINQLVAFYGVGRADVVEMAVRQLARKAHGEGMK